MTNKLTKGVVVQVSIFDYVIVCCTGIYYSTCVAGLICCRCTTGVFLLIFHGVSKSADALGCIFTNNRCSKCK